MLNNLHTGSILTEMEISLKPHAVYDGGFEQAKEIKLRLANGGAGQSGLIGAWADAFIQYCVAKGSDPFLVGHFPNTLIALVHRSFSRLVGIWEIPPKA